MWIANALIHSSLLYWLSLLALKEGVIWANGRDGGYIVLGNFVYTVCFNLITVLLRYQNEISSL